MERLEKLQISFSSVKIPQWATVNPFTLNKNNPHTVVNFLDGKQLKSQTNIKVIDPLNGQNFIQVNLIEGELINKYAQSQKKVPKWGLHNPIKNVERYNKYGDIFFKIAAEMRKKETQDFFVKLIQRVMPKSTIQCLGQYTVTRKFFENFTGDNPRFLMRSFNVSGDHDGQTSTGYRWPYGNVAIITPFNFPIQIPCLQLFGSLLAGNRPVLKCDLKMSICMEQFLLMSHYCGLPLQDVNFINCSNNAMEQLIEKADFKMLQFTGSSKVAEHLSKKVDGKIRIQDAGYDWKVLGPDVSNIDYVAWTSDQDSYGASGQKCSAQSVLFVHQNWILADFYTKIKNLAQRRKLTDLTIGPIITWNNRQIQSHIKQILKLNSTKLLFGGNELKNHTIPEAYGSFEPTAIQVNIQTFKKNLQICTTQLFGPFQIIVPYKNQQINQVIEILNSIKQNLTAGVVSNDPIFLDKILGQTINGTTYAGIRARTTGAPQNHWFGPCGDPRAAGIGTKQAILHVWTSHREIIRDFGPINSNWKIPEAS